MARRRPTSALSLDRKARQRWKEQPWLVAIVADDSLCGSGFVVASDRVLTAAHVVAPLRCQDIRVELESGEPCGITKVTKHDRHDVAVLTLDREVAVERIGLGRIGDLVRGDRLGELQPVAVGFDGAKKTCLRHEVPGLEVTSDHELNHRTGVPEGLSGCPVSVLLADGRRRVAVAVMSLGGRGRAVSVALRVDAVASWSALRGVELVDLEPTLPPESQALEELAECLGSSPGLAAAARAELRVAPAAEPRVLASALVSRAEAAQEEVARKLCQIFRASVASAEARLRAFNALWVASGRFEVKGDVVRSNNPGGPELGEAHRGRRAARFVLRAASHPKYPGISPKVPFGATCFYSLPPGRHCLEADDFVLEVMRGWWEEHRVKNKGGTASNPDPMAAMKEELAYEDCQLYIVYRVGDYPAESVRKALGKLGLPPHRCIAYGQEGPADTIFETLCNLVLESEQETQATNAHDSRR